MKRLVLVFGFVCFFTAFLFSYEPVIAGGVEHIVLNPPGLVYEARLDTGAAVSSVNAFEVTPFLKEGDLWVRFSTSNGAGDDSIVLEKKVVSTVKVRQAGQNELQNRYTVTFQMILGGRPWEGEFTLADRRSMEYPVLIGRNLLEQGILVDVSQSYRLSP